MTEHLPSVLENWASDRIIIKYILNSKPDIIAVTCYLWNIERSADIARNIKSVNSSIQIFFGGPEINAGSWIFTEAHPEVDLFVSGEGEWFFRRFLNKADMRGHAHKINGNNLVIQPESELLKSEEITEPFIHNRLNPMMDGSIFIEMTRGCPYRCSYCQYSKNVSKVRELPFSALTDSIKKGEDILKEIYILSPTFNRTGEFTSKLEILKALKHKIRLHTEIRTDNIDDKTAALFAEAGFASCEIGLQTLSKKALERVSRKHDTDAEIKGILALRKAGIRLQIGIIPGLPDDDPVSFRNTADFLIEKGLTDSIELYPLMILPGTRLRDEAVKERINFMKEPPYYFLEGWNFTFKDIQETVSYIENASGFSLSPLSLPDFTLKDRGILTAGVSFNGNDISNWNGIKYRDDIETSVFTFYITLDNEKIFTDGIKSLITNLPCSSTLFNIVFFSDIILDEDDIYDACSGTENVFNGRLNLFTSEMNIRFYQIFNDTDKCRTSRDLYSSIIPIQRVTDSNIGRIAQRGESFLQPLLITKGMSENIEETIQAYSECCDLICFEDENEKKIFYENISAEYILMPFDLMIKRY